MKGALRRIAEAAGLLALCACAGTQPAAPSPAGRPAPEARQAPSTDPSYDWHPLVLAPFGTVLHASGLALREVLVFHDRAPGLGAEAGEGAESGDCYTVDSPPPFAGRATTTYLLCFEHDRLSRIEAAVRLEPAEAAAVFARACALWLRAAVPAAATADRCEGSEQGIAFHARLEGTGEPAALLSMTLSAEAGAARPLDR
jgi:hypothetical protein